MGTSSDPRLSKKVGRFYCGRLAVRTLRIQDATDRMTAWLSDPEALEILNVPARRLTKTDIANHIRGFDQRTVRSATIGSFPPFGSRGLRPTFRALSKEPTQI